MPTERFQVIRSSQAGSVTALQKLYKEKILCRITHIYKRPESQNGAIQQLQSMGYSYVLRAETEREHVRLSNALF